MEVHFCKLVFYRSLWSLAMTRQAGTKANQNRSALPSQDASGLPTSPRIQLTCRATRDWRQGAPNLPACPSSNSRSGLRQAQDSASESNVRPAKLAAKIHLTVTIVSRASQNRREKTLFHFYCRVQTAPPSHAQLSFRIS